MTKYVGNARNVNYVRNVTQKNGHKRRQRGRENRAFNTGLFGTADEKIFVTKALERDIYEIS